jgi:hypothetical protein
MAFGPDANVFAAGWDAFRAEHCGDGAEAPARRVLSASLALWMQRGHAEVDASPEDAAPDAWDLSRVRRRLERALVQGGLLMRRARVLSLIADCHVAFQERGMTKARLISIAGAKILDRRDAGDVLAVSALPRGPRAPLRERQRAFDAHSYDRLRVLVTELRRVCDDQGQVAVRIGDHTLTGARLARWIRVV